MDKLSVLRQYFGHDSFRPGQGELVDALLQGRDVLGVMPTGAGKSVCYQVPALLLPGITLVISPLISLMMDQVAALKSAGVPAAYLNSSLTPRQLELATQRAAQGAYRIIYVAPERLEATSFLQFARQADISLVAVDEAHCVSQWGQDFRPHYLRIADFIASLRRRPVVGAFTATATERVKTDIVQLLGLKNPLLMTTGFDRPNLFFEVVQPAHRDAALAEILARQADRSGIVYCATRKNVEKAAAYLQRKGFSVARYHAGLSEEERRQSQEDFQYDRVQVMVATNAFGMGIDKSNVAFVIHYNMPKSMEAYYQEAGRAGRDGSPADCVLLYSKQDIIINRMLIQHGSPMEQTPDLQQKYRDDMNRLYRMVDYCEKGRCLRGELLRYFGQATEAKCGHCANCVGGKYSFATVVKPTTTRAPRVRKAAAPAAEVDEALFEQLRQCRLQLARELRVPPYIVFEDKTLRDMSAKKPATEAELLSVNGVGQVKASRYGARFLPVIQAWLAQHPAQLGMPDEPPPDDFVPDDVDELDLADLPLWPEDGAGEYSTPIQPSSVHVSEGNNRAGELGSRQVEMHLPPDPAERRAPQESYPAETVPLVGTASGIAADGGDTHGVGEPHSPIGTDESAAVQPITADEIVEKMSQKIPARLTEPVWTNDMDEALQEAYLAGASPAELAHQYGCTRQTLITHLTDLGMLL